MYIVLCLFIINGKRDDYSHYSEFISLFVYYKRQETMINCEKVQSCLFVYYKRQERRIFHYSEFISLFVYYKRGETTINSEKAQSSLFVYYKRQEDTSSLLVYY